MSAIIIDGKEIAAGIHTELESEIKLLQEKHNVIPGLAVILVGENPASLVYVKNKGKACEKLGIHYEEYRLMATASERELLKLIKQLNDSSSIHGILVQLPLPNKDVNVTGLQRAISPFKDVDGIGPESLGNLLMGEAGFVSCTPLGVQELLTRSKIEISGKHVVIIGRSNIVGKPLAALLMQKEKNANATVTVCHSKSIGLKEITKQADILVAAIGQPEFVTADMVKEKAVVIDVGMNRINDPAAKNGTRLVGDVEFNSVKDKASFITPVPGGVGPMTIAMLMYNTVKAAKFSVGVGK